MSRESSEQRTCVVCHAPFVAVGRQLIKKITCSDECAKIRARQMRRLHEGYGDGRNCAECGVLYCPLGQTNKTFCSDECRTENVRRRQREFKRRELADPKKRRISYERKRLSRKNNPELARAQDKRKWLTIRNDPEKYRRQRDRAKVFYQGRSEEIQTKRRQRRTGRMLKLTDAELERELERSRRYQREWRRRWRAAMTPDQVERRQILEAEYRRRRQIAEADAELTEIQKRVKANER